MSIDKISCCATTTTMDDGGDSLYDYKQAPETTNLEDSQLIAVEKNCLLTVYSSLSVHTAIGGDGHEQLL